MQAKHQQNQQNIINQLNAKVQAGQITQQKKTETLGKLQQHWSAKLTKELNALQA